MNQAPRSLSSKIGKTARTLLCAAAATAILLGSTCNLTNKAPSVPVVSGPSSGVVGVPVTFKATATDPEGDSIAFQFDWGDTTTPAWSAFIASGETLSLAHTFPDSGTYLVKAMAKDLKGKASDWSGGHALSVLAKASGAYPDSVYAEIPITEGGLAGAITPGGMYLYVAHGEGVSKVTPIRLADRAALAPITLDAYPNDIVSSADGTHMYVTLPGSDQVAAIRTSDNTVDRVVSIAHRPQYMATTPDGQFLLVTVAEPDPGMVLFLQTTDLSIADTVYAGANPSRVVADRTNAYAYVRSTRGVRILDLTTHHLVDSVDAIANPQQLGLSRNGQFLHVASPDDSGFVLIRLSDRAVERRLNVGVLGIGAFASTLGDEYLMFSHLRGVKYVDTRTYAVVDSLELAGEVRRALVMHPTADTMYMIGWNKVYIIGPK